MLPTEKTPRKKGHKGRSFLLYGPTKIGKSTFCSQIPNALFIATEDGLGDLEVYQQRVLSWLEFMEVCAEIRRGDHPFESVVIDTVDNAWRICSAHVLGSYGKDSEGKPKFQHESDLGYGKGWALVSNEFRRVMLNLSLLPYGLWLIAHSSDKTLEDRTGDYIKTIPNLPKGGNDCLRETCDFILLADFEEQQLPDKSLGQVRVLRTAANKHFEAGGRIQLPDPIPLNFQAFEKEFRETEEKIKSQEPQEDPFTSKPTPTPPPKEKVQENPSRNAQRPSGVVNTRLWMPPPKEGQGKLLEGELPVFDKETVERAKAASQPDPEKPKRGRPKKAKRR